MSEHTWQEGTVYADWTGSEYAASIRDGNWNGWAIPRFTRQTADQIITDMMRYSEPERGFQTLSWHTEDGVDFIHIADSCADSVEFVGPDADGMYPLGAMSWTWNFDD